jgi:hypothetical protein
MSDLPFDDALAASYVGKYIVVGLTHVDRASQLGSVPGPRCQEGEPQRTIDRCALD